MDLWVTEQETDQIRTGWAVKEVLFSGQSEFQTVDPALWPSTGTPVATSERAA